MSASNTNRFIHVVDFCLSFILLAALGLIWISPELVVLWRILASAFVAFVLVMFALQARTIQRNLEATSKS